MSVWELALAIFIAVTVLPLVLWLVFAIFMVIITAIADAGD